MSLGSYTSLRSIWYSANSRTDRQNVQIRSRGHGDGHPIYTVKTHLRDSRKEPFPAILVGASDRVHCHCAGHCAPGVRTYYFPSSLSIHLITNLTCHRVYVGYPNIAQDDVNDSTLKVKSISITDPTPDSFHLNQTQILGTDSVFHPHFYEFNASASLSGSDKPFTVVQIPPMKANDGTVINVDQDVKLEGDGFGDFATAVMLNKEVDMNLVGYPNLKQGALPKISVTYNKTVTIKGEFVFFYSVDILEVMVRVAG